MAGVRPSPIAGRWYPGTAAALNAEVQSHLSQAPAAVDGDLVALVAPHAGLMYSGAVAAHAYALLKDRRFDVAVLVGPSHFVGFDGAAIYASGGFATPLGIAPVDAACAADLVRASPLVRDQAGPHAREHSLEMQLPFVQLLAPVTPIVPVLVGYQTEDTARGLGEALAAALRGRRALIVASTDLSHYYDAGTASRMDATVIDCVKRFDADGLQQALVDQPEHACGGGPLVSVMRAAQALGARDAVVLAYADSGDVTGDKSSVVGYMAAALGTFTP
jgi:AmmeMemoRadiSam system protein B